jgi:hypothetical protein
MRFTFNINKIVQLLAVTGAVAPQYIPIVPNKNLQAKIAAGAVVVSAVAGLLAHFSNPDGTSVKEAYQSEPSVPKMPEDWKGGSQ